MGVGMGMGNKVYLGVHVNEGTPPVVLIWDQ